jgi:CPA2 family monovalent cation:H+ antiporter-2
MAASSGHDISLIFIELGASVVGLAVLARVANRWGFSSIPLYLIAGLAFGNGGLLPLGLSAGFIHIGGEIGVLLLLFMLGLEYSADELRDNLRVGLPAGAMDFLFNFPPGVAAGRLLGWPWMPSVLLGGVTWISSSGIIAKVLADQHRLKNPETPTILSVLVLEDLAMAVYLPLVAVLLLGGDGVTIAISVSIALAAVAVVLFVALRYGGVISRWAVHESDEVVLLTTFGAVLLVAAWRSGCRYPRRWARFWWESRCPGRSRNSRTGCWLRCGICSRPRSFSSSAWRSIRPPWFRWPCRRWGWAWSRL